MSLFLYFTIILLWGLTWFAIKNQVGLVPVEISLIYRFSLAAIIIFGIILYKKIPLRFSFQQHRAMVLLGILIFSTNFICFYSAAAYLTSGLIATIFSTSVIMIMLNSIFFLKKSISANMIIGAILGLIGLACLFWPELEDFSFSDETCLGILLALLGTYSFSWGNQVSTYCTRLAIPLLASMFYGMLYGVMLVTLCCFIKGIHFAFDSSMQYVVALLYLAIPGTVIGYLVYLGLIKRLGPEKAVYTTLFFPIVALCVSTFFEFFEWTSLSFMGLLLILSGNLMVLIKPRSASQLSR